MKEKLSKYKPLIIVVVIVAVFIRLFIIDSFVVKGDSMAPTILDGDYVFINKLAYEWNDPQRFDIIVTIPRLIKLKILKRIVALPDERLEISEGNVVIKKERTDAGTTLEEPFLEFKDTPLRTASSTVIKLDPYEYFVMGDNRYVSIDSREIGPIDLTKVKGKVFLAFSLKRLKIISF
jgi:signal peptidase I